MGRELSSVEFRSVDEQLFRAMQKLFRQQDRHFAVRVVGQDAPVFAVTPMVKPGFASPDRVQFYIDAQCSRWPFCLKLVEAQERIESRIAELPQQLLGGTTQEAETPRRQLHESPVKSADDEAVAPRRRLR
jgi:hypothetical protein